MFTEITLSGIGKPFGDLLARRTLPFSSQTDRFHVNFLSDVYAGSVEPLAAVCTRYHGFPALPFPTVAAMSPLEQKKPDSIFYSFHSYKIHSKQ